MAVVERVAHAGSEKEYNAELEDMRGQLPGTLPEKSPDVPFEHVPSMVLHHVPPG